MKILLILIMMIANGTSSSNHLPETNCKTTISKLEFTKTAFARVYFKAPPSEVGETERNSLYEFDCSVPKWKKNAFITACEISEDIELVIYEFENYKGDYNVYSQLNNGDLLETPKKFSTPGSIKVLYKGNKDCISSINQNVENAREYVSVEDEIKEVVSTNYNIVEHGLYIVNHHTSKTISVRYRLRGRAQHIHTATVKPDEKKYIIGYRLERPRNITILSAEFLNE